MKKVLLIHGPNLNLTGMREPGIYGTDTLASINAEVVQKCERLGMDCSVFQSNSEGALIDRIHAAREDCDAIIMNAGAYTHYSYAIRDAIAAVRLPCVGLFNFTVGPFADQVRGRQTDLDGVKRMISHILLRCSFPIHR